eukprot:SAG11_NODE_13756_length_641_cov_0.881919_1_plen_78_part_00
MAAGALRRGTDVELEPRASEEKVEGGGGVRFHPWHPDSRYEGDEDNDDDDSSWGGGQAEHGDDDDDDEDEDKEEELS